MIDLKAEGFGIGVWGFGIRDSRFDWVVYSFCPLFERTMLTWLGD